jgi:hypothetical protein
MLQDIDTAISQAVNGFCQHKQKGTILSDQHHFMSVSQQWLDNLAATRTATPSCRCSVFRDAQLKTQLETLPQISVPDLSAAAQDSVCSCTRSQCS